MDATLDRVKRITELAEQEAREHNQDFVGTEHILLGLLDVLDHDGGIATLALESQYSPGSKQPISLADIRRSAEQAIVQGKYRPSGRLSLTRAAKKVIKLSRAEARKLDYGRVGSAHILLGLLREGRGVAARVLHDLGVSETRTRELVSQFARGRRGAPLTSADGELPGVDGPLTSADGPLTSADRQPAGDHGSSRGQAGRSCQDLTREAADGRLYPALGRDQEIAALTTALRDGSDRWPLLVGDAADLMTVLTGLAQRIVAGRAGPDLQGKRLRFCHPDVAAGEAVDAIKEAAGRDDLILAADVRAPGSADSRAGIRPAGRGWFIGIASPEDYRLHFEHDDVLARQVQPIHVPGQTTAYSIGRLQIALRAAAQGPS